MRAQAHTLYQTSTMSALVDGIYDGSTTIAELLEHGDFGVGTFNHLDGEMVVNEGVCFHLFSSGEARVASPDDLTPFAAVTTFEADTTFDVTDAHLQGRSAGTDRRQRLEREPLLWDQGHAGASPRCPPGPRRDRKPPTGRWPEATDDESEQTFTGTDGVLVGFRTPDYEQGISVAGYHLHFLNDEHTGGGHAFDFVLDRRCRRDLDRVRTPAQPADVRTVPRPPT